MMTATREDKQSRAADTLARETGELPEVRAFSDGWEAFFSTELAALRMAWLYRASPGIRCGFSKNLDRWHVAMEG